MNLLNQNPLYKLNSYKRLCHLLKISKSDINNLTDYSLYKPFKNHGKMVYPATAKLKKTQNIIKKYLDKIYIPEYVFSPSHKGSNRNHISNAIYHKDNDYLLNIDIKSFYENTSGKNIFRFFYFDLKMSIKMANIITNIVSYKIENKIFIPRGTCCASLIAYFANKRYFDLIHKYTETNNILFSIYVDDMGFSSKEELDIKNIINYVGLVLKSANLTRNKKKTKYYKKNYPKLLTGIIITKNHEIKIPNKKKYDLIKKMKYDGKDYNSIIGSIAYIQSVEGKDKFESSQKKYINNKKKYDKYIKENNPE